MQKLLKLSHHHHSGFYRPHEYTSYIVLFIILLLTGSILAVSTLSIHANSPPPQSESVSLSGVMPEPPPQTGATITSPTQGQRFGSSPITVSGTCPGGTLVEILKNDIFAGSTICGADGTFSIEVDLLIGENQLSARVYNSLNQPGPVSEMVTVFYDAVPPQEGPLTGFSFAEQLLISTDAVYRGTFPGETLIMPIEIINGTPPYALEVRWGDNEQTLVPRDSNLPFTVSHVYRRPGSYQVNLQATDAEGRVAFLSVVVIINGELPELVAGTGITGDGSPFGGNLMVLWPLFAATLGMVLSFWVGEQREKRLLERQGLLTHQPSGF